MPKTARGDEALTSLADFIASLIAPAIVRSVELAVESRLGSVVQQPAMNGHTNGHNGTSTRGGLKEGKLSKPQERVLKEMVHFNKGKGGSIFHLPHATIPHAQKRLANSLARNGMIVLENGEQFQVTDRARHYFAS
jgi:hypothetical protein